MNDGRRGLQPSPAGNATQQRKESLPMNANLGKTTFTPEEIDDLRDRLKAHKTAHSLSWATLSQVTGVPAGTLSSWVPGDYNNGNYHSNHDIPAKIHRFFLSMSEKEALEAAMPSEPDFQLTTSSRRMMTVMALSQLGDMGLISTPPGVGKTASIRQYAATHAQVFVMTASPAGRGVPTTLIGLLAAMGERDAKGTPQTLSERVRSRLRGAGALLIIDEAQHLSAPALEEVRSIHDDTGAGVVLSGDETLAANLKKYPQLYSRLGVRHSQPRPLIEDITTIAAAWGVDRGAGLAYLQEIGRKSGGIRTLTKTLKLAVRAARAGGAPLDVADLRDAWAQRFGEAA
jgi:DNA transposition AAA+ family ATPase